MNNRFIKIVMIILVFTLTLTGCSNTITDDNKVEIKTAIDIVLSNNGYYTGDVTKYVGEETYYTSNYSVFYSLFLGQAKIAKYESEIINVEKKGNKYIAYVVLNMEAESTVANEHSEEAVENEEPHNDTAIGEDVPVEVVLKKKGETFYIKSTKEYNSLDEAVKSNEGFKK